MAEIIGVMQAVAAAAATGAATSGWTAGVIVANQNYDGLDASRADRMLRRIISGSAGFQALLLGVATGFALLGGARVAAIIAGLAALGFFSNIWTLSPRKEKALPGARKRTSGQRVVAVALTLMMTAAALTAAVMAIIGI